MKNKFLKLIIAMMFVGSLSVGVSAMEGEKPNKSKNVKKLDMFEKILGKKRSAKDKEDKIENDSELSLGNSNNTNDKKYKFNNSLNMFKKNKDSFDEEENIEDNFDEEESNEENIEDNFNEEESNEENIEEKEDKVKNINNNTLNLDNLNNINNKQNESSKGILEIIEEMNKEFSSRISKIATHWMIFQIYTIVPLASFAEDGNKNAFIKCIVKGKKELQEVQTTLTDLSQDFMKIIFNDPSERIQKYNEAYKRVKSGNYMLTEENESILNRKYGILQQCLDFFNEITGAKKNEPYFRFKYDNVKNVKLASCDLNIFKDFKDCMYDYSRKVPILRYDCDMYNDKVDAVSSKEIAKKYRRFLEEELDNILKDYEKSSIEKNIEKNIEKSFNTMKSLSENIFGKNGIEQFLAIYGKDFKNLLLSLMDIRYALSVEFNRTDDIFVDNAEINVESSNSVDMNDFFVPISQLTGKEKIEQEVFNRMMKEKLYKIYNVNK